METKKVADIISEVDYLKPNGYNQEDKIKWIQNIEDRIQEEVIDTHENPNGIRVEQLEAESVLVAAGPYKDIYVYYCLAQIDKNNEEYARYNNNITLFNDIYKQFRLMWHNTYLPIGKGKFVM